MSIRHKGFVIASSSGINNTWGQIKGSLADQTDLIEYIADDEEPPCKDCIIEYFTNKVEREGK